jgi:hypothetical protein
MELIRKEQVDVAIDLHEAELQYPVISTIVTHQRGQELATMVSMTLTDMDGFKIGTEFSPPNLHGLSHREIGDHSQTISLLFETPEPFLDATRGVTSREQLLTGRDEFVVKAGQHGLLFEKEILITKRWRRLPIMSVGLLFEKEILITKRWRRGFRLRKGFYWLLFSELLRNVSRYAHKTEAEPDAGTELPTLTINLWLSADTCHIDGRPLPLLVLTNEAAKVRSHLPTSNGQPGNCGGRFWATKLLDAGVAVTPGVGFGKHGEGYVRMTFTQPLERIREACARIQGFKTQVSEAAF